MGTIMQNEKKSYIQFLKDTLEVPIKELKISDNLSFLIFEIAAEPYYIKILG